LGVIPSDSFLVTYAGGSHGFMETYLFWSQKVKVASHKNIAAWVFALF